MSCLLGEVFFCWLKVGFKNCWYHYYFLVSLSDICLCSIQRLSSLTHRRHFFFSGIGIFYTGLYNTLSVWPIKNCWWPDVTSIDTMMAWHGYTIHDPFLVHSACKWKDCHLFNKKITFHVTVLFENYYQVFPSLNHKRHSLDTMLKILIECGKSIISCLKYRVSSACKESEIITLCFVAKCEYWSIFRDNNIVLGHFEKLLTM